VQRKHTFCVVKRTLLFAYRLYFALHHHLFALQKSRSCNPKVPLLHDKTYIPGVRALLQKYGLQCVAISAHLTGQCVGDVWDERLDMFAPKAFAGQPEKIKDWAINEMKDTARAAAEFGVSVVNGFTGSPLWARWYAYPPTPEKMIDEGFQKIYDLWSPILDVFDGFFGRGFGICREYASSNLQDQRRIWL